MRFATLQDHLDCDKERAIERVASIGLDGLELVVPDGVHDVGPHGMDLDSTGLDPMADELWSAPERERLRGLADDHGVSLPSVCPSFLNFRPGLTAADGTERATVAGLLKDLVAATADVGGDAILVPFFRDAAIEDDAQRERVATALGPVADAAAEAGVTLGIENTLPADENRALLDAVDSPAAGIYYDVGNATSFGYDPAEELRTLADDVVRVHFKDGHDGGADAMLGEGQVDFEGVADALDAVGYDDWIVLETSYEDDPVAAMEANLAFARDLLG